MTPEFVLYLLLISIGVVSYLAFENPLLKSRLLLKPTEIRANNEYYRLITSGFVHADYLHLGFNLFVFHSFGKGLILTHYDQYGRFANESFLTLYGNLWPIFFIALFMLGVFVANIPSYFKNRFDPSYASLGASGGVSSIVFAFIIINPFHNLYLLFIPIGIPGIIFGILYLIFSHYQSRKKNDNINHEAHLWGAIFGVVFMLVTKPELTIKFYDQLINYRF